MTQEPRSVTVQTAAEVAALAASCPPTVRGTKPSPPQRAKWRFCCKTARPPSSIWLRTIKRAKLRLLGGGWRALIAADGFRYVLTNAISEADVSEKIARARKGD